MIRKVTAAFLFLLRVARGLQLLTHRYYDPSTGRFLTRDPISYAGGINLYSYVQNNPINFIDPLGLELDHTQRADRSVDVHGICVIVCDRRLMRS